MSNTIVLRRVFATDSNTGLYISTAGQVLVTDDKGGTNWMPIISSLTSFGGPMVGVLPSTLSSISSQLYVDQSNISVLQYGLSNNNPGQISLNNLTSTVAGLGNSSYISTLSLISTSVGLSNTSFTTLQSTVDGLGELGYVSTAYALESTVEGLGSSGYVSTLDLTSTIDGLGSINYISSASLLSSLYNLTSYGYVSTNYLTSSMNSTVAGLGSLGVGTRYISSASLQSTVAGLGQRYVSTASLVSTTIGLSTIQSRITFTNVNTCFIRNSIVNVSSVNELAFLSSFYYSSLQLTPVDGSTYGTSYTGQSVDAETFSFSTVKFDLAPFSNYIVSTSKLSLEVYPTYIFSKISDGAQTPGLIAMSTLLQVGFDFLSAQTTSYIFAQAQGNFPQQPTFPLSNMYNQPIRIEIPPSSIVGDFTNSVTLYHYLPYSVTNGGGTENRFTNSNYSFYYGQPGAYLTVHNNA
jgi:hypothetical protein